MDLSIIDYKKYLLIGSGILVVILGLYIGYLKYEMSELNLEIAKKDKEIVKLTDENTALANTLKKANDDAEIHKSAIEGLQEKNKIVEVSKSNEVDLWKLKYNNCIKTRGTSTTMKITDNKEVMNNETSDFYIDLYNNNIFTK